MVKKPCLEEFQKVFTSKALINSLYNGMQFEDDKLKELAERIKSPKSKEDEEYRNTFFSILDKCAKICHYADIGYYLYDMNDSKVYEEIINQLGNNINPINSSKYIEEVLSKKYTKRERAKFMLDGLVTPLCGSIQFFFMNKIVKKYKPVSVVEEQELYLRFCYLLNSLALHPKKTIDLDDMSATEFLYEINSILDEMIKDIKENNDEALYGDYLEFGYFRRITDTYSIYDAAYIINKVAESTIVIENDPDKAEINKILDKHSDEFKSTSDRNFIDYDNKFYKLGTILRILYNHYSKVESNEKRIGKKA